MKGETFASAAGLQNYNCSLQEERVDTFNNCVYVNAIKPKWKVLNLDLDGFCLFCFYVFMFSVKQNQHYGTGKTIE